MEPLTTNQKLTHAIDKWNASRVPLFRITSPNQAHEFNGVVRFFHQDGVNYGKYVTKCVRVSSTARTVDVIETLSEKFRGDLRMLTHQNYALYEVHAGEALRKLSDDENPLFIQLEWNNDDLEGRFLLMNEDDLNVNKLYQQGMYGEEDQTMRKPITSSKSSKASLKKETKKSKKKAAERQRLERDGAVGAKNSNDAKEQESAEVKAARNLYNEVPESTFTRTVSNPEAVLKKRREQRLQKRGAEMMKIYGHGINPANPSQTILLLPEDKIEEVMRQTLEKYRLGWDDSSNYNLFQIVLPPGSDPDEYQQGANQEWGTETLLKANDTPLGIKKTWQPHQGTLMFEMRHKQEKAPQQQQQQQRRPSGNSATSGASQPPIARSYENPATPERRSQHSSSSSGDQLPAVASHGKLIELCLGGDTYVHSLQPGVNGIGSDPTSSSYNNVIVLQKVGAANVLPLHCCVTYSEHTVVTITPLEAHSTTWVQGKKIGHSTIIKHNDVIVLGIRKVLIYCGPNETIEEDFIKQWKDLLVRNQIQNPITTTAGAKQQQRSQHNNEDEDAAAVYRRQPRQTPNEGGRGVKVGYNQPQPANPQKQPYPAENKQKVLSRHQFSSSSRHDADVATLSSTMSSTIGTIDMDERRRNRPLSLLPCSIELIDKMEMHFLERIMATEPHKRSHFLLSPAYTLYLILRDVISRFNNMETRISFSREMVLKLTCQVQKEQNSIDNLAFWMANISEVLNFMRQDQDLLRMCQHAPDLQSQLANNVQLAFRCLVGCMQNDLIKSISAFFLDTDDDLPKNDGTKVDMKKLAMSCQFPTMLAILKLLHNMMNVLRRCRVNAALTIQLFSQSFHSINMYLFNELVSTTTGSQYCTRVWGYRLRVRLSMVENWAKDQGLEMAAECHLARITHASTLLEAPKLTRADVTKICGESFKLNSFQLRRILMNYQPDVASGETQIPPHLIDQVVADAESYADALTKKDNRPLTLEEEPDLRLPFLFPDDGYSCEVIKGVPSGLDDFLLNMQRETVCIYHQSEEGENDVRPWMAYFINPVNPTPNRLTSGEQMNNELDNPQQPAQRQPRSAQQQKTNAQQQQPSTSHQQRKEGKYPYITEQECALLAKSLKPEIIDITLRKRRDENLGLSIKVTRHNNALGTYVELVIMDGAAHRDGRIHSGDELISVDGHELGGLNQERAAQQMKQILVSNQCRLKISKYSAIFKNLNHVVHASIADLLLQLSTSDNLHRPTTTTDVSGFRGGPTTNSLRPIRPISTHSTDSSDTYQQQPPPRYPAGGLGGVRASSSSHNLNNPSMISRHQAHQYREGGRKWPDQPLGRQPGYQQLLHHDGTPTADTSYSARQQHKHQVELSRNRAHQYVNQPTPNASSLSASQMRSSSNIDVRHDVRPDTKPHQYHQLNRDQEGRGVIGLTQPALTYEVTIPSQTPANQQSNVINPPRATRIQQLNHQQRQQQYQRQQQPHSSDYSQLQFSSTGQQPSSPTTHNFAPFSMDNPNYEDVEIHSTLDRHSQDYTDTGLSGFSTTDDEALFDTMNTGGYSTGDMTETMTTTNTGVSSWYNDDDPLMDDDLIDDDDDDLYTQQQQQRSLPAPAKTPTAAVVPQVVDNKARKPKKTTYQKQLTNKSTTLPRQFKHSSVWGSSGNEQQRLVQEQLNAERDEEIVELQRRISKLSVLERERLKGLLSEQKFQEQVMDGKKLKFPDEVDVVEELELEVPDRPDRDRLIRMQDSSSQSSGQSPQKQAAPQRTANTNNNNNVVTSYNNDTYLPIELLDFIRPNTNQASAAVTAQQQRCYNPDAPARVEPPPSTSSRPSQVPRTNLVKVPLRRDSSGRSSGNLRPKSDGFMLPKPSGSSSSGNFSPTKDPRSARERLFSNNNQQPQPPRSSGRSRPIDPSALTFKDRQRMFQRGMR